jgi:hypothetical protein
MLPSTRRSASFVGVAVALLVLNYVAFSNCSYSMGVGTSLSYVRLQTEATRTTTLVSRAFMWPVLPVIERLTSNLAITGEGPAPTDPFRRWLYHAAQSRRAANLLYLELAFVNAAFWLVLFMAARRLLSRPGAV